MTGYLAPVWFHVTDLDVVRGEGCWVYTSNGTKYLDFTAGIAVVSTGHCHPEVVAAIQNQAAQFIHAQVNCYSHNLLQPLADELESITPAGIDTFFYTNSGAEATEAAVKLVKQATKKPNIIVFNGSFHGRTHMTMAMTTSKTGYRAGYNPLPGGVFISPFPSPLGTDEDQEASIDACLAQLDYVLASQSAPSETAAMIIEPEQGEGGYTPAPQRFLEGVAQRCSENGILFVADEVQAGFGRTGKFFAVDHYGITPDVLIMAKGIASGFPFSAVGASKSLMEQWPTGSHGGTYGGNPVGCAAALATIGVMKDPAFLANVVERGEQLRSGLRDLAQDFPVLGNVRGLGLMVAAEFLDPDTGAADAARCAAVIQHCRQDSNVLMMNAGTWGNVIRFMPPLVVSEDEITLALDAVQAALIVSR
ncbi:MAG TPA: aminotransferase class III-fold pyridoxal phosphate-dependent enzyme [Acidimicrobiia bacterium]|nr:aminotransferase class III-fold pyridoxal phosphate-dependent enzyme [Acidimicrobiia bacterium]